MVATIVFPSVKPADLLATLGIGSVAIGFAFKDILQNWLSGLLILWRQPFRPGDQIVSGGHEGTVEHIEARATLIRTYDGQRVVIPNSDIYTRRSRPDRLPDAPQRVRRRDRLRRRPREGLPRHPRALGDVEGVERDPAPEAIPWTLRFLGQHPCPLVDRLRRHRSCSRGGGSSRR